jgi:hypothetical protein
MRPHPLLIAAAAFVVAAAAAGLAVWPSSSVPAIASDCGHSVSGQGFRAFSCMSGGAAAGHPHPKELLVVRSDGSSAAYPVYLTIWLGAGDGEVVATYDGSVVRVTSGRLVSLVTRAEIAQALHLRPIAIWNLYDPRVDVQGDVYFNALLSGCRKPLLERTAAGTVRVRPQASGSCRNSRTS